jgi:hypothetical protein
MGGLGVVSLLSGNIAILVNFTGLARRGRNPFERGSPRAASRSSASPLSC